MKNVKADFSERWEEVASVLRDENAEAEEKTRAEEQKQALEDYLVLDGLATILECWVYGHGLPNKEAAEGDVFAYEKKGLLCLQFDKTAADNVAMALHRIRREIKKSRGLV